MVLKYVYFISRRNLFLSLKQLANLKEYQEKRLVGYTAEEMFNIAANVSEYPQFVPWCQGASVTKHSPNLFTARLKIGFPPVCETYTSRVSTVKPSIVRSVCTDKTLFKILESTWQFSADQTNNTRSCTLIFSLTFEFHSVFHTVLAHHFFDHVVESMVVAFLKRAETKYGPPSFDHYKNFKILKKSGSSGLEVSKICINMYYQKH
ncbi:cyclase/dehydrase [Wuchereria bancrofti]|uniref:Cyclase/dehydrase n=1 Tax=Wuchereria bancrofti TaxID=6293 RepID=J9F0Z5_WUCBA|nr:cyclase/dehydrase [Wuchereria bancrofti]